MSCLVFSIGGVFLVLSIIAIVGIVRNLEKSWKFALTFEIVMQVIVPVPAFVLIYFYVTNSVPLALMAYIFFSVLLLARDLFGQFVLHKPLSSKRYRLPLIEHEGMVVEKYINLKKYFLREWIIFNTADGQQIKAYIQTGDQRKWIAIVSVGDTGTFRYRKGKDYNYFEEFTPKLDDSEY